MKGQKAAVWVAVGIGVGVALGAAMHAMAEWICIGAVVGATFDGHNRYGEQQWTTQGKVIEADPGRGFAFECSMMDFHYSTWGYRIEPTESGCRVTEWNEDLRPESAMELSKQISGVEDRTARNSRTMSGTLERLAAALES